jgi:copper chaperone
MIEFQIDAMTCGHCVSTVTKTVKAVDPAAEVNVDLASHTVQVESTKDRRDLAAALAEAGYTPR